MWYSLKSMRAEDWFFCALGSATVVAVWTMVIVLVVAAIEHT